MNPNPDDWAPDLPNVVKGMAENLRPRPVLRILSGYAARPVDAAELGAYLRSQPDTSSAWNELQLGLACLDSAAEERLGPDCGQPQTPQRRAWTYAQLGLGDLAELLDERCEISGYRPIVIAERFEPWYWTRGDRQTMYWDDYRDLLIRKGWHPDAVNGLDQAATEVVERLADPRAVTARQTRGLVVGYVQSGKTANFTAVIAKAIDAGYRLIIVLTGTIENLRSQTQRRLDMELVGRENILQRLDPSDPVLRRELDYQDDPDWLADRFTRHGEERLARGTGIRRVTKHLRDYERITGGRTQLTFERPHRNRPLYDPDNLQAVDAYLAVVKKHTAPLDKLVRDLNPNGRLLEELPLLIIDDESDQASVDTTNPRKWRDKQQTRADRERTAINRRIRNLIKLCPRAQYVGYTATPFANVFIDPDDDHDLFPSDFLISLRRPEGYMGVQQFHDLGRNYLDEDRTVANSNEKAFVRAISGDRDDTPEAWRDDIRSALDAFVLSAAIKKYREAQGGSEYRHHTMLIHESVSNDDHRATAEEVRSIFRRAGYTTGQATGRLRRLFDGDYLPVMLARAGKLPVPPRFDDLRPHLAAALAQITRDRDPVIVVNSAKDVDARTVDFEKQDMWCILIGGTKLSRGFTVEGLTISVYRRKTLTGDTMMQAGRWFGFRPGYADLVRLYIRRDQHVDLYQAFEALMRDEEAFRDQLSQYSGFDEDGQPIALPRQIPPLVTQHLPWLRPTARNKMWNAKLQSQLIPGRVVDYYGVPARGTPALRQNWERVALPLIAGMPGRADTTLEYRLGGPSGDPEAGQHGTFSARTLILPGDEGLALIHATQWHPHAAHAPRIRGIEESVQRGGIVDWLVIWPEPVKDVQRLPLSGVQVPIIRRARRPDRITFVGSDNKHRAAGERFLNNPGSTRGVLLMYLVDDRPPSREGRPLTTDDVTLLYSIGTPAEHRTGKALVWSTIADGTALTVNRF